MEKERNYGTSKFKKIYIKYVFRNLSWLNVTKEILYQEINSCPIAPARIEGTEVGKETTQEIAQETTQEKIVKLPEGLVETKGETLGHIADQLAEEMRKKCGASVDDY